MGAVPSWLDKYVPAPADATAVSPAKSAAPYQPTIGPNDRPDWAARPLPQGAETGERQQVKDALNLLGIGNPLPKLYDAQQQASQGRNVAALGSLAAAVPLTPESEGLKGLSLLGDAVNPVMQLGRASGEGARMVEGFIPGAEAVAREGVPEANQLLKWRQERLPNFAPPKPPVRPDVAPQNLGMGVMTDADVAQSMFTRKPPAVAPKLTADEIARLLRKPKSPGAGPLPANYDHFLGRVP